MKNPESNQTYVKLNENIEKSTRIFYIFMVQVTFIAIVVPQFITSFYLYLTTDLGTEAFNLPLPIWCVLKLLLIAGKFKPCTYGSILHLNLFLFPFILLRAPFNWRTPTGYLIIFTFESSTVFCVCHFCFYYLAPFVASCYIIFNFANEIKNEIHALNDSNKAKVNSVEFMRRVGDIVEFHAVTKQLSNVQMVFDVESVFKIQILFHK